MSIDKEPQMGGMENPIGNMEPPKSKKKIWILGGLGCFGLIIVVCGGGGLYAWLAVFKPAIDFTFENIAIVETSPAAEEILGSPITVDQPTTTNDGQNITLRGSVSGPDKSGTYVVEAHMEGMTLTRDAIYLEVDGERYDLDAEEVFNLDINEGD